MKPISTAALILVLAAVANALTATQIQQVVNAHNSERALVGLGPVTYNATIGAIAQSFVDGCPSDHSDNPNFGENMYWGGSQDLTSAVNLWAGEKQYWDCETNRCCEGGSCSWYPCGHYTQIVWSSSVQIGCGIKYCGSRYTVVCNYFRPGNWNCNPFCDRPFPQANCPVVPVAAPRAAPVAAPVSPPRAAPVAVPVAAPKAAPVAAPVAAPRAAPVAAPVAAPKSAPVATPVAAPRSAPVAVPVAAPKSAPVAVPVTAPASAGTTPSAASPVTGSPQTVGAPAVTTTPSKAPQAVGSIVNAASSIVVGVTSTLVVLALL